MNSLNHQNKKFEYGTKLFENGIHNSIDQESFLFLKLKGQGAFGKVYQVRKYKFNIL